MRESCSIWFRGPSRPSFICRESHPDTAVWRRGIIPFAGSRAPRLLLDPCLSTLLFRPLQIWLTGRKTVSDSSITRSSSHHHIIQSFIQHSLRMWGRRGLQAIALQTGSHGCKLCNPEPIQQQDYRCEPRLPVTRRRGWAGALAQATGRMVHSDPPFEAPAAQHATRSCTPNIGRRGSWRCQCGACGQ